MKILSGFRLTAVLFLIAVFPAIAAAQSHFLGNTAEPVAPKHWEFYLAVQYDKYKDVSFVQAPQIEVNYGLAPDLQLHLVAPFQYTDFHGGDSHYGYGDTEVGAVYRFVRERDWIPQFSVYPRAVMPTGDDRKGLGTGELEVVLPVLFKKTLGSWQLFGGAGYWLTTGLRNENFWETRMGVEHALSERFNLGFELYHHTRETDGGDSRTGCNVGARVHVDKSNAFLFSVGRDFNDVKRASVYGSYVLSFGP